MFRLNLHPMRLTCVAAAALLCGMLTSRAAAQADTTLAETETRAALEARAAAAERAAATAADDSVRRDERMRAEAIRTRLRDGDFNPGDRIWLSLHLEQPVTDTVTVRAGRRLLIADFPAIDLTGVLRSELDQHLSAQLSRYVREPRVHAVALMRVGVLGEVARPGYFSLRSDALLSDALSAAGGPTILADVSKVVVRRDGKDLWPEAATHVALQQGVTLAGLGLESGDEIVLAARPQHNWTMIISTVAVSIGVLTGVLGSFRR